MSEDAPHAETLAARAAGMAQADTLSPADRYRELFEAVQMGRVFDDGKTFVDCVPKQNPERILDAYRAQRETPDFDLARFVHAHFTPAKDDSPDYVSPPGQNLAEHIDGLWDVLTRTPHEHPAGSSLIALPHDYVVPGGRFRELYYWDSYFVMLGLAESRRSDLLRAMADNFAYLIDTYGHVPNGNRMYYLSRSQPPVFALMVQLFEAHGIQRAVRYLPQLRAEYAWWMDGADDLRRGQAHRHSVRLDDGSVLNRYWDDRDTPREESFREDVETAKGSTRPAAQVYRNLRAGAASGWDFSSRWCGGDAALHGIRVTSILPVDLNSLLHVLETQIARLSAAAGEPDAAADFERRAAARRTAMQRYFWNDPQQAFFDFDFERDRPREALTGATVTPLFARAATREQGHQLAQTVRTRLLETGGLVTSATDSGQQWDRPNGWAPLQWFAAHGFYDYGEHALAADIGRRWLDTVASLYRRESKLVEKYVLTRSDGDGHAGGGGGEYPLQDGFGWTNGVVRRMLRHAPAHRAQRATAASRPHD